MMKRILLFIVLLVVFSFSPAQGQIDQKVEISSSPNPVGSGARALGMGGAFIGVADDATAASWNPAGLIQLETPEISIVGAYNYREEDTTYQAFPEASDPQDVSLCEVNYLSVAYPFTAFNKNMIVSLNYQHLYDFNKKVSYSFSYTDTTIPLTWHNNANYDQEGSFKAISPAIAVQITPCLSLGMTLNLWDHGLFDNKWESRYRSEGNGTFVGVGFNVNTRIDEAYKMDGLRMDLFDPFHWHNANYNLGLMWNINSMLTFGAVFKSPFEARLNHDYHFDSSITFPTSPASNSHNEIHRSEKVILDMPMSYGLGLAFRISDSFTFDLDVFRTEWGDYILHDAAGNETNPITGKQKDESSIDPTTQIRFGGEYLFIGRSMAIPVRAGIFYDPEPAENSPDDFYGISLGSGIAYKKVVYDIAYQYRFGRDVRSTTVGNDDSSQDVDQHTIYMSLIYHF